MDGCFLLQQLFLSSPQKLGISLVYYFEKSITQVHRNPDRAPYSGVILRSHQLKEIPADPPSSSAQSILEKLAGSTLGPMSHSSLTSWPLLIRTPLLVSASPEAFWVGISNCFNHHLLITTAHISSPCLFLCKGDNCCEGDSNKYTPGKLCSQICQTQCKRLTNVITMS